MYGKWYGVCNVVVFLVVEVFVNYGTVYVFHVVDTVLSMSCSWCWDLC